MDAKAPRRRLVERDNGPVRLQEDGHFAWASINARAVASLSRSASTIWLSFGVFGGQGGVGRRQFGRPRGDTILKFLLDASERFLILLSLGDVDGQLVTDDASVGPSHGPVDASEPPTDHLVLAFPDVRPPEVVAKNFVVGAELARRARALQHTVAEVPNAVAPQWRRNASFT